MKNHIYHFVILLMLICSCNDEKSNQTATSLYYTETNISAIEGILESDTVFGPPNYGETPSMDTQEIIYKLKLDKAITVINLDNETKTKNTIQDIFTFQLVGSKLTHLKNKIGKKIKVNGVFSIPISGHHQTDIIFDVK
jgi:hypothetical protein